MKIIVSPAKRMEQKRKLPVSKHTQPEFFKEAVGFNRELSQMSTRELSELMKISDKLAELNYGRYRDFDEKNESANGRPAVYLYSGDVYQGLDAYTIPVEKVDRLQDTLRILTGMYGILRPLDLIQPYRLEMGTPLVYDGYGNLYDFWREKVTDFLNDELKKDELFLNLASNEYAKAVDKDKLQVKMISPIFKDFKNGQLKIISFYAKKARGAMVRFILDQNIHSQEDILGFDYMDYRFSEQYTEDENQPVFIR